jgi:hypothetical protein
MELDMMKSMLSFEARCWPEQAEASKISKLARRRTCADELLVHPLRIMPTIFQKAAGFLIFNVLWGLFG